MEIGWIAQLFLFAAPVVVSICTTQCPEGHLAVCVESGQDCRCRCAKDANAGASALASLMQERGASMQAVNEAAREYQRETRGVVRDCRFVVEDSGRLFEVVCTVAKAEAEEQTFAH